MALPAADQIKMYRTMALIRRFEQGAVFLDLLPLAFFL